MHVIRPDDARLTQLLAGSAARFQTLVREAEAKARPFYAKVFGQPLGIHQAIERILAEVEAEGDVAVARYNQLFDGCAIPYDQLCLGPEALAAAWERCPGPLREALNHAAERIETYQERLIPRAFAADGKPGIGARWRPVDRAGAYVPGGAGGSLPLCSTVLMNLLPAAVAGVPSLVMATPPRNDGTVADALLAAAYRAGVERVYRAGGVQGVAALAMGTQSLKSVDTLVGPGNLFVTLTKRAVYGRVQIDMLAGPSEVLVIADDSVDPAWAAADLLSQAEHDELATCLCCAIGEDVARAIAAEVPKQLATLPEGRRAVAAAAWQRFGAVVACDNLVQALALANRFAPEHCQLLLHDPAPALAGLRHAGAIFVGRWSPEPMGDYLAGPSHTLPTGGSARMFSGIGADTFLRRQSVMCLGKDEFFDLAESAMALARAEGLEAHARSVAIRLGR